MKILSKFLSVACFDILATITLKFTFTGTQAALSDYSTFTDINFGDSTASTAAINWIADGGIYVYNLTHDYNYGTFYPTVFLRNNISSASLNDTIDVDQCAEGLQVINVGN